MNRLLKRIVQSNISKLSKEELQKATSKLDVTIYDNQNTKIRGEEDYPTLKQHYVHRHRLIRKGIVHFSNVRHRQEVSYFHPWMKGYLEKVGKALWSQPPTFCKPSSDDKKEPQEDETIKQAWEDNRLQEACRKGWIKSQVHGILFFYPMKGKFFKGYSGPQWTVYSLDEMGEASQYMQGHPVRWTITHSNKEKTEPKEITITQGIFYDYKNTDDFTGEPFGAGIWDLMIDWLWIQDAVNAFDQRMGNGFFTLVVPNSTDPTEIAKYEDTIRNTRTEMGIVVRGAVEEPVQMNWVGMAGVQVDFIAHMSKLEDLIAFNMGFPKRWIMGDAEGARENGSNDALAVNIQLKNLYTEWILFIKLLLQRYNLITDFKDIIIKPPFELQLSEQEQIELGSIKADTIAKKVWLSVDEQRVEDGYEASGEEGADKVMVENEETESGAPGTGKEDQGKTPSKPKSKSDTYTEKRTYEITAQIDKNKEGEFRNYLYRRRDTVFQITRKLGGGRWYFVFDITSPSPIKFRDGAYWKILKTNWEPATKMDTEDKLDTFEALIDVFTNKQISIRQLAKLCNVSPTTVSKIREKMDSHNKPTLKRDEITFKCDAVALGEDIYEIEDVPVILPQSKRYEHLGYEAERPKDEIKAFFESKKYPKEYRIGVTVTDDHTTGHPLEIPNENTVGTVHLNRLDEEGNIRANIRYSLKDADRILGTENYIRELTQNNQNIPTSVALRSRDVPTVTGKYLEQDLDIRSFVFSKNHTRNKKAGL